MASNTYAESDVCVTFIWDIENYSYCWQKRGEYIESPVFSVDSMDNASWILEMYPRGKKDENFISYFLHGNCTRGTKILQLEWDLGILEKDDSVLQLRNRERIYFLNGDNWSPEASVRREDVTIFKRESFLSRDTLRSRCRMWRNDGEAMKPITIFARTVLTLKKRNFLWEIERFSSLESSHKANFGFTSKSKDEAVTFDIGVYEKDKIKISIKSNDKNVKFEKFQSFVKDSNGFKIDSGKSEISPNDIQSVEMNEDAKHYLLSFTKKYLMDHKNFYLKNDILSLYCEYSWSNGYSFSGIERIDLGFNSPCISNPIIPDAYVLDTTVNNSDDTIDLIRDLECLYANGILWDVELRTTTQTFHAHKNILSARSPVFQAMFETNMKEKAQERVDIPDLDDDTVRRMLLYVYTDGLKDIQWEKASRLFSVADKYEILSLKNKCSHLLKESLCPSNVCEIIVLADMHHDIDLKEAAQRYALEHDEDQRKPCIRSGRKSPRGLTINLESLRFYDGEYVSSSERDASFHHFFC
ncbi:speckle-type POZ protein-like B [Nephila pilipes]|uniref:Speckle-type POZ protein-like B n=1 Tax=Nephila pilipes TaxID=299642 RepID=A0A8X6JGY7_NEPPI|nr:speckle-type POZ protein-like B [Nephila pilipes]